MASQSDDQDQQKSGEPSSNHPPPPQGSRPPPPLETPSIYATAMGYPPQMGYPGGYPPPPHPNYGYPPAHVAYYYNRQQPDPTTSFVRGVFIGVLVLVFFMAVTSIVTWLVLRPELPTFHLNTFSVSNFKAMAPATLVANWDANITARNPNTKLKVYFNNIEAFVFYDNNLMGSSADEEPLVMDTKTESAVSAKVIRNTTEPEVDKSTVEEMAEERGNKGKVMFDLRVAFHTTFKRGSWWTRHASLKMYCQDLVVEFGSPTNNFGSVAQGMDCLIFG